MLGIFAIQYIAARDTLLEIIKKRNNCLLAISNCRLQNL